MMPRPDLTWAVAGAFFGVVAFATLALPRFDRRMLDGITVWSKPFKFALSLAIYFLTFAVIVYFIPSGYFRSQWPAVVAYLSVLGGVSELGYIYVQAARGRHSHFNRDTRLEAVAYSLMGLGAVLMLAPAFALGLVVMLFPPATWPLALALGTALGLLGGAALTIVTASRMGAVMSHFAKGNPKSRRAMWLTGWSIDGSDLRPAHFVATHMMQAVPLLALAAQTLVPAFAVVVTVVVAILWTTATVWLFRHALRGGSLASLFPTELANILVVR